MAAKSRGTVVVSGASTGIGEATAIHLAEQGFRVFAGVRREADGAALQEKADLTPLIIDITDELSVLAAGEIVARAVGNRGLAGLVNNAGVAIPAPIEFQPLADFRRQLEVNLIGHVAMTQAFLPLIRRGKGRIVNIGSVGGLLVLPLNGAYSASKFGMEALSDALRLELRQWGIHVSHVDVGPVHSAIFGKTYAQLDGLKTTLGDRGHRLYKGQIAAVRSATEKAEASADPPKVIAKAVFQALTADSPKTRYLAGHGVKGIATAAKLPDRARTARWPRSWACRRRAKSAPISPQGNRATPVRLFDLPAQATGRLFSAVVAASRRLFLGLAPAGPDGRKDGADQRHRDHDEDVADHRDHDAERAERLPVRVQRSSDEERHGRGCPAEDDGGEQRAG